MAANNAPASASPAASTNNTKYSVIVRDEEFRLTRRQLEFDSPNYFTSYFFGDFAEGKKGVTTVEFDRCPTLFALIVEYMSGYSILPLSRSVLPRTMNVRAGTRNLAEDAAFYGLTKLHNLLTRPAQPTPNLAWTGFSSIVLPFEDVLGGRLPKNVSFLSSGLCGFEGNGGGRPVIVYAKNLPLRFIGCEDDRRALHPSTTGTSSPTVDDADNLCVSFALDLSVEQKMQLDSQPVSVEFEYRRRSPYSLVVGTFPDTLLHVDAHSTADGTKTTTVRFQQFEAWWHARESCRMHKDGHKGGYCAFGQLPCSYMYAHPPLLPHMNPEDVEAFQFFDSCFPRPPGQQDHTWAEHGHTLWADDLLFVITGRGYIAGSLQLQVKLLDVRARTRSRVIQSLRPLVDMAEDDM